MFGLTASFCGRCFHLDKCLIKVSLLFVLIENYLANTIMLLLDTGYTDEFQFLQALKNGYRMEKPEHTPNCVAEVMQDCWKADPDQRPTFSQIEEALDGPLESLVTSFYLQLNEDCQRLNIDKRTYENFSVKSDFNPGNALEKSRNVAFLTLRCLPSTENTYV